MIYLLYRARTVGPVCARVARGSNVIQAIRDDQPVPNGGTIVRWGSVWPANGNVRRSINSAEAVAVAQDKIESRRRLGDLAPATFFRKEDLLDTELVVRPRKHYAGKLFYVCNTHATVNRAIQRCGKRGWYASELIQKATEYRVFVCQQRIVAVSERFPADNAVGKQLIAWNLAVGGTLINVRYKDWPIPVCKAAILAAERLGLDWCAIDAAVDISNNVFVFEGNCAPGLRNPFTIQQIARVFTWIDGHDTGPVNKGLIHPALRGRNGD